MRIKQKIIFIIYLLFLCPLFIINGQDKTNPNIEKAKSLIMNRQYDYAIQILNDELKNERTDKANDDLIRELIKFAEAKKAELEALQNSSDKQYIPVTKRQSSDNLNINKNLYKRLIRSKNINIMNAFDLMKEKKFNEALKILADEMLKDRANEELIMELIVAIEKEKDKVTEKAYHIKETIKNNDFTDAENNIRQLEEMGEFDETINNIINKVKKEKDPLQKINEFNNLVSNEGEKALTAFDIKGALDNYKKAMDIFRVNESGTQDARFNEALARFNDIEKRIFLSGMTEMIIKDAGSESLADIQKNIRAFYAGIDEWRKFEQELAAFEIMLERSNVQTKALLMYEAYRSISAKYQLAVNRSIQKNAGPLLASVLDLALKNIEIYKTEGGNLLNDINTLIALNAELEKFAFYNNSVNLINYPVIERGKGNIVRYLEYINKKNNIVIAFEESKLVNDINRTNINNDDSQDLIEKKRLYDAEAKLKQSDDIMNKVDLKLNSYENKIKPYSEIKNEKMEQHNRDLASYKESLFKLKEDTKSKYSDLSEKIKFAEYMIDQGNELYTFSVRTYTQRDYDKAKENFISSKDKYVETLITLESQYVDRQIDAINKYLSDIEDIIFRQDMKKADEFKEKAIDDIYKDNFENAKLMVDNAESLFNKHKVENEDLYNKNIEDIKFWRDKILTAIKVRSGSRLSIDDPAYEEITELMNSAKNYFNQGKYEEAFKIITQVLNEKPYFEDARLFEIKLLLNLDKKIGEQIFENRYKDAKAKYDREIYDQALIAFNQLLQFNRDVASINRYILECRKKLGFIRQDLTQADRNKAAEYVRDANDLYINGSYNPALDKVLLALRIWPDVPKGRELKAQISVKLKIPTVQLTKENEVLYKRAGVAYAQGNYDLAYRLTLEILKTQDLLSVRDLNKRAQAQLNK